MANLSGFEYEVCYRWWLKPYIGLVAAVHSFIVNYIDMDAELNWDRVNYWISRGVYLRLVIEHDVSERSG